MRQIFATAVTLEFFVKIQRRRSAERRPLTLPSPPSKLRGEGSKQGLRAFGK
jgi:hypothetical protein